ncbi:5-hydroxytryptamine receptor 2A [Bactrocera dorsalis]|uniref:5-hydroxytryptamine receptor 2A n=1 Tax=Bactrocera dorsalis TaxID=27457 RepID=A0A6I9VI48_BACDO|nr:5-hydroxytryptamine receptor 2A [Bactrocera dorsalis]XP_049308145.1 5-hydroxytryptamine receptor 2A [Bactrocera dorsalis]
MSKLKDAHDYIFIADGSGGGSSAYVFSASVNAERLSTAGSYSHKRSNSRHRTHRRTPIGGAPTKRPKTSPSTPPPPPPTHNMLPFSFQQQQYEEQQEDSLQQRMVAKAFNVTTTTATAVAATTAAIIGFGLSTVGHAAHNALGSSRSSHADSSNHNLQQMPRQQQHLHRHQHSMAAAASFATSPLSATLTTTATTVLTAAKAAATATATTAAENLFSGVAVGLGAMLINDTLLLDTSGNGTSVLFANDDDDDVDNNGSDLINGSMVNLTSGNATVGDEDFGELLRMGSTSVVLGLLILITIIGNVFVIAAIILERNLQNVANYLVASLAVADLFVACLVMPLGAVYEISQGWILGPELCDIWTSCDVLCCTASILHLVAIALDRYWAVTNIDYIHSRTSKRVFLMIFSVWSAAVIVSLAPQFGWKDPDYLQRIEQQKCMVSQDVSYQVFATCCTFYVPLLVILALYWKIYQTARKRIHRRRPRPIDVTGNNNQPDLAVQKKRNRLRLRIGKFGAAHASTAVGQTTLGLVEGNSTNTVNTVEDTEFSSSNVDSKSRAGVESTTMFSNNPEEIATTSTSQISTVSHLVALANQQHTASKSTSTVQQQQQQQQQKDSSSNINTITTAAISEAAITTTTLENNKLPSTTATTTTSTTKVCIVAPNDSNGISSTHAAINGGTPTATAANGAAEVLEDPQLQQQLQQVQQHADTTTPSVGSKTAPPAACASNATTITSISALSPQTPTTAITASNGGDEHLHPLAPAATPLAATSSCQLTPTPKLKHPQPLSSIANPVHKVTKRKETLEAKRERKAAKTLAIITGAFVICWLPFFVMALLLPLCETCEINDGLASVFLWLGYFNSTLNPVIYTIFSPEFRQAFKRILFGGHRPVHYRSGKI